MPKFRRKTTRLPPSTTVGRRKIQNPPLMPELCHGPATHHHHLILLFIY
jgi:hypothetical protein